MLLENIPGFAVPIVQMLVDQSVVVQGEFAPARNRNSRFPGQGRCPTECPVGADLIFGLLDIVEVKLGRFEKPIDQANHLLVFFHPPKLRHGIFEKDVFTVETIGLVLREAIVVLAQGCQDIHGLKAAGKLLIDVESTIIQAVLIGHSKTNNHCLLHRFPDI